MYRQLIFFCAVSAQLSCAWAAPSKFRTRGAKCDVQEQSIERDVLIVGGGASGTYAAVKLKDQKKTVAIVELSNRLGGHANTLIDPVTSSPIDYGVQAYIKNEQTLSFFNRFNVPLVTTTLSRFPSKIVDFRSGALIPNATATNPLQLVGPLASYLVVALKFPGISEGAYDLADPVPEDLLLPFGQFVTKYNLTQAVPVVWIFAHSVGNLVEATTLYVLQNFGAPHLLGLQAGYLSPPSGTQLLYDRAADFLASDVLYKSTVLSTTRTANRTIVVVQNVASGCKTTFHAKKLLVTIPPTLRNMAPFDLDQDERALFSLWQDVPYYVGVLNNTGLPDLTNFYNVEPIAPYALPQIPFIWRLETVGVPGYQTVKVVGEPNSRAAQALVKRAVSKIRQNFVASTEYTEISEFSEFSTDYDEFSAWKKHTDLALHVSPQSLRTGFYRNLYALQGRKSTWYTGNAWCSDLSPLVWGFTEKKILPALMT